MKVFTRDSLEKVYIDALNGLLTEGKEVSPRGIKTKEITPVVLEITDPRKRVIPSAVRKLNFGFMVAELVWMLRGSDSVDEIAHYNSSWRSFSDDGNTLNGAYGKRIFKWNGGLELDNEIGIHQVKVNQFREAYEQLKKDKYSRQATIVFFNPVLDYKQTKDKPCTNLMRFSIRDNKLNMLVCMRSNDIQKGLPYDFFNFSVIQELMAGLLTDALGEDIQVGKYTHIADSFHVYESDFELSKNIINENYPPLYGDVYDGRLIGLKEFNETMKSIFEIEEKSRTNKEMKLDEAVDILNNIKNNVWRSYGAILATYNFRKYRRSQEELNVLKEYITNEFKDLFKERYNQLF